MGLLTNNAQNQQPQGNAYSQRGQRTFFDPLAINKNPFMGAAFNPIGEAFIAKSPAPLFDPIGYTAGWYKPGSKMGNAMNTINDPLKIFKNGLGGLF